MNCVQTLFRMRVLRAELVSCIFITLGNEPLRWGKSTGLLDYPGPVCGGREGH